MKTHRWTNRSRQWVAALGLVACSGCAAYQDWQHSSVNEARARWSWWTDPATAGTGWVRSDFAAGYRAGWYAVAMGGDGRPPAVPPREYWKPWYQSAAGCEAIQRWYEGFHTGATSAESQGVGHFTLVPSQGGIAPHDAGFVHHAETDVDVHRPTIVDTPTADGESVAPPHPEPIMPPRATTPVKPLIVPPAKPLTPPAPPSSINPQQSTPPKPVITPPPKPPVSVQPKAGSFESQTVTPPTPPRPQAFDTTKTQVAEKRKSVIPVWMTSKSTPVPEAAAPVEAVAQTESVVPRVKAKTVSQTSMAKSAVPVAPLPPESGAAGRGMPVSYSDRSKVVMSSPATCEAKAVPTTASRPVVPPVAPEPVPLQASRYDRRQDEVIR
ncbi:MAG: hypothetical protein JNM18_14750 [Planctomycetaceae bacterium]|nr:hypothetical protein [Planctomycetaceae bacterium]